MKIWLVLFVLAAACGTKVANNTAGSTSGSGGGTAGASASTGSASGTSSGAATGLGSSTSSGGLTTGSSTGASSGSSTGTSTGPSTGSSTGTSTGSSTGTSTGSSTGSPPPTSPKIIFVNAAPDHVGSIDLCVKDESDAAFGATGVAGSTSYTVAHSTTAVPMTSADFRIVAAGGDCSTALGTEIGGFDVSDQSLTYTVVAYDNGTDNLALSVAAAPSPDAGKATLALVDALVPQTVTDALDLALAIPYSHFGSFHLGDPKNASGSISPLIDATLWLDSAVTGYDFLQVNVAADSTSTLILFGHEGGAKLPGLLVCDETGDTPVCTPHAPTPMIFMRVANLLDASDVRAPLYAWLQSSDDSVQVNMGTPSAVGTPGLLAETVGPYVALPNAHGLGTNLELCITTDPAPCTTGKLIQDGFNGLGINQYYTWTVGGAGGAPINDQLHTTNPFVDDGGLTTTFTTANHLFSGTTNSFSGNAFVPVLFNQVFSNSGQETVKVPLTAWQSALGWDLDFFDSVAPLFLSFTLPGDLPSLPNASLFYGGNTTGAPYLLYCNNDGTLDALGNSACTNIGANGGAHSSYVRFADLSPASPAVVDICNGANPLFSGLKFDALPSVTGFLKVPPSAVTFAFTLVDHANGCIAGPVVGTASTLSLAAGKYYTAIFTGDVTIAGTVIQHTATPPLDATHASISFGNDWNRSSGDAVSCAVGATNIGASTLRQISDSYTPLDASDSTPVTIVLTDNVSHAVIETLTGLTLNQLAEPYFNGGVYSWFAFDTDAAHDAGLYMCADNVVDALGHEVCAIK